MEIKCSWWIVKNKKWEILLTKQIDSNLKKSNILLKKLKKEHNNDILEIMKLWDCSLTKWKIEEWKNLTEKAIEEIEEEWWIKRSQLEKISKLWCFFKKKVYWSKKITIFLFKLKWDTDLNPKDKRHISGRFDLDTALKIIKPKEKEFLKKNIEKIKNL